jgi:hypothetical protein
MATLHIKKKVEKTFLSHPGTHAACPSAGWLAQHKPNNNPTELKQTKKIGPDPEHLPRPRKAPIKPKPCSFLAPAKHHRVCSSLRILMMVMTEGATPSKTHPFLCFHKTQAPKIIRELTPFLYFFFTLSNSFRHQLAKFCSCCSGTYPPRFNGEEVEPDLSCYHTGNKKVLYCLVLLIS